MNIDLINLALNGGCAAMLFYIAAKLIDKIKH